MYRVKTNTDFLSFNTNKNNIHDEKQEQKSVNDHLRWMYLEHRQIL